MKEGIAFKKIDENTTEIYIQGTIREKSWIEYWLGTGGNEVHNNLGLREAFTKIDTPNILVRINSYGGSVTEGLTMYSLLRDFNGHVTTLVDGIAGSIASIIFMAGEERIVPENGLLMIHNPYTTVTGNYKELMKMSEDMFKISQPSVNIYCKATGLTENKVRNLMDNETWLTSKECLEMNFATSIEKNKAEIKQDINVQAINSLVEKLNTITKKLKYYEEKELEQKLKIEKEKQDKNGWASFFNI